MFTVWQYIKQQKPSGSSMDDEAWVLFLTIRRTLIFYRFLFSLVSPQYHHTPTFDDNRATLAHIRKDCLTTHVTYIDVTITWINEQFVRECISPTIYVSKDKKMISAPNHMAVFPFRLNSSQWSDMVISPLPLQIITNESVPRFLSHSAQTPVIISTTKGNLPLHTSYLNFLFFSNVLFIQNTLKTGGYLYKDIWYCHYKATDTCYVWGNYNHVIISTCQKDMKLYTRKS